jgi:primosomal replication protein N
VNRLQLTATLAALGQQRYTPAGLPAIDVELSHQSQVSEAGQLRTVNMSLVAIALGPMSERISRLALGAQAEFIGFLAPKSLKQNGKQTVFHIQDFQISNEGESHGRIQKI